MKKIKPAPPGKKFRLPRKQKKRIYNTEGGRIVYFMLRNDIVLEVFRDWKKEEMHRAFVEFFVTGQCKIELPVHKYKWLLPCEELGDIDPKWKEKGNVICSMSVFKAEYPLTPDECFKASCDICEYLPTCQTTKMSSYPKVCDNLVVSKSRRHGFSGLISNNEDDE